LKHKNFGHALYFIVVFYLGSVIESVSLFLSECAKIKQYLQGKLMTLPEQRHVAQKRIFSKQLVKI